MTGLVWLSALAWFAFFVAAGRYIAAASALTDFVDAHCPELWQQLVRRRRSSPYNYWRSARKLDLLIVFNVAAAHHPADPAFRALLGRARIGAAASLFFFLAALILLAAAAAGLRN